MNTEKTSQANTAPQKTLAGRWIHVFSAGTHKDKNGRERSFSQADLDQIIANHELGAAPAVIGHPKENAPAYGWVDALKRDGDKMFAKFRELHPTFDTGVQTGAYRNRSVSLYEDGDNGLRLRHVGWLGAAPPAIDGLEAISFSDEVPEEAIMEFATPVTTMAWALESIVGMFRGFREYLIADKGIEEADRILPNYALDSIASDADRLREGAAADNSKTTTGDPMSFTKEQLEAAVKEAEEKARAEGRQEAEMAYSKQVDEANQKAAAVQKERQTERITAQIDGWKKEGKVLPADTNGMAEFMASLDAGTAVFEFSASDGETKSQAPSEWFAEFMAKQPARIGLGKKSSPDDEVKPKTPEAIAAKAVEFQKEQVAKGIEISMTAAVAHVSGE